MGARQKEDCDRHGGGVGREGPCTASEDSCTPALCNLQMMLCCLTFIGCRLQIISPLKDAAQDFRKGRSQEWQSCQGGYQGGQKEEEEEDRVLCHLHLQGAEAGSPRHWSFLQGDVHHELVR